MKKTALTLTALLTALLAASCLSGPNIHRMVEKQSYKSLRTLLFDPSVNPDTVNEKGETPIQIAIDKGYNDIVDFLLTIHADPNRQDNNGETPLFYAVKKGSLECIQLLEKYGVNFDIPNKDGNTALQLALEEQKTALAKYLVDKGADVFFVNKNGQSPAQYAMLNGDPLFDLIATDANVMRKKGETSLLSLATQCKLPAVIKKLIRLKSPMEFGTIDGESLILYALQHSEDPQFAEIVILFAENGVQVSNPDYAYIQYYVNSPKYAGFYSQGGFPLHKAAAAGHLGFVRYFMGKGFSINKIDDTALTPLHNALLHKRYPVANFLIQEKADLNPRTPSGDTALTLALQEDKNRQESLVSLLIRAGSDISVQNNWGSTPLLLAIQNGYSLKIIDLLIDKKGNTVIARNNDGITPLHAAVKSKDKAIVSRILKLDNNINAVDNAGETPFFLAVDNGFEFLSWFIDRINVYKKDEQGNSILHLAIMRNSDTDLVKLLIIKGIPLDQRNIHGDTPFIIALKKNNAPIAKLLLEAGANLFIENKDKENPMSIALTQPWEEDKGWITNEKFMKAKDYAGNTPLSWAISYDRTDVAMQILNLGTDVNQMNNYGRTPLHTAILHKNKTVIAELLKRGADPNLRDYAGNTIYHYMVMNDSVELISLFQNYKIDLNTANIYGKTALHEAIYRNATESARLLIDNGADIFAKDNFGRTLVHFAAGNANLATLSLLQTANAPFNERDNDGNTPLHLSLQQKQDLISTYLISNGADIYAANSKGETPIALILKDEALAAKFSNTGIINNRPDNGGRSPLHLAVLQHATVNVIHLLINRNAYLESKDRTGKTALLLAVQTRYKEAAKALLDHHADIFAMDQEGETPFALARRQGFDTLDWFLSAANLNVTDNQGNTPLHHAAIHRDRELYTYLIKRGAQTNIRNKDGYTADSLFQMPSMQ